MQFAVQLNPAPIVAGKLMTPERASLPLLRMNNV